jgi:hypothetical protein
MSTLTALVHSGSKYLKTWPKFEISNFMEMPNRLQSEKIQTLGFSKLPVLLRFLDDYLSYSQWYLLLVVSQDSDALRAEIAMAIHIFRRFRKIAKSGYLFRHVHPPVFSCVRLSVCMEEVGSHWMDSDKI